MKKIEDFREEYKDFGIEPDDLFKEFKLDKPYFDYDDEEVMKKIKALDGGPIVLLERRGSKKLDDGRVLSYNKGFLFDNVKEFIDYVEREYRVDEDLTWFDGEDPLIFNLNNRKAISLYSGTSKWGSNF